MTAYIKLPLPVVRLRVLDTPPPPEFDLAVPDLGLFYVA